MVVKKLEDTNELVTYAYGVETQNTTGKIQINKSSNEVTCLKMADDDSASLFGIFARLVRHVIADAGYPNVRSIATG